MNFRRFLLCSTVLSALITLPVFADNRTFLLSDSIEVREDGTVIARGHVEATAQGHTLFAEEIIYDPNTDRITVPVDHVIYMEDGTILNASEGWSTEGMSELFLKDLRTLLEQRLQLTASSSYRTNQGTPRTKMNDVRLTACKVCNPEWPPIWELRAPSVVHDEERRFIYLRHARFHVWGIPIVYTPWLRVPDPTVDRATGFLPPTVRSTDVVKLGVEIPYFINLSPHHDVTLTPFMGSNSRSLTAVYRRAFRKGDLTVAGYFSDDEIANDARAALVVDGDFKVWDDFNLNLHLEAASDDLYLNDYGIDSSRRRESTMSLSRIRFHSAISAEYTYYTPLRTQSDDLYQNNIFLGRAELIDDTIPFGDSVTLSAFARSFDRGSDSDIIGRDMRAVTVAARWQDVTLLRNGMSVSTELGATLQSFSLQDDSRFTDDERFFSPYASVALEWPHRFTTQSAQWVVNPRIAMVTRRGVAPNSDLFDPVVVELDDISYLSADTVAEYSPSVDGFRLAAGFEIERIADDSLARFALGRVFLDETSTQMQQQLSSWVLSGQYQHVNGYEMILSALADNDGQLHRTEMISSYDLGRFTLGLDYYYAQESDVFEIPQTISEWRGSLGWQIQENLSVNTSLSYDLVTDDFSKMSWGVRYRLDDPYITVVTDFSYDFFDTSKNEHNVGINYRNECVDFLLTAKLENDEDSDLDPVSVFEFKVDFLGYTSSTNSIGSRKCKL